MRVYVAFPRFFPYIYNLKYVKIVLRRVCEAKYFGGSPAFFQGTVFISENALGLYQNGQNLDIAQAELSLQPF
jgi:hypothetical protein